jgi:hypothetical protein
VTDDQVSKILKDKLSGMFKLKKNKTFRESAPTDYELKIVELNDLDKDDFEIESDHDMNEISSS